MAKRPRTLFVTVGSTLFEDLTNAILSTQILGLLPTLGVGILVVQYGRAGIPESIKSQLSFDGNGSARGVIGALEVELFRYTDDFEGIVATSQAVISHAGSGSILTVLRRDPAPPLLIVPNESLMDNHQAELADEMGKQGYLMVSRVEQLKDALPRFLNGQWEKEAKPFPAMDKDRFRNILDETMGFV